MSRALVSQHDNLKWPLIGAAALIALSLGLVAIARLEGVHVAPPAIQAPVATRELRFEDRADGGIAVIDGRTNRVVDILEPGSNGFVRGVLRALSRDRMMRNLGSEPTFLIIQHRDGIVSIEDRATGHRIALNAFGQTNVAAFVRLMKLEGATR